MKRLLPFVLLFAQIGCGPTKRVAGANPGLTDVPGELPGGTPPDLTQTGDEIVQADELDFYGVEDSLKLQSVVAKNTAYISIGDEVNQAGDIDKAIQGVEVALNTLSTKAQVKRVRPIGQKRSLLAVDLRDFFGTRGNDIWKLIEDTAVLKIQSQTTRNKQLQFITGKRIPIMHAKVFLETAFIASTYYNIQETPATENEFWQKQGIDRQADFDAFEPSIFMAGFQVSLIAPGHNRTVRRMENAAGDSCWNTYDVDSLFLVPQSNFFAFPFPVEARRAKNFIFNAGEIICIKANGFMTFALYAANGNRADAAPTTVVVNTRTGPLGLDTDIKLRDCLGCHANTMVLPFIDEMRSQIQTSNVFSGNDKRVGDILFRSKTENDSITSTDNQAYEAQLSKVNVSPGGVDPVNKLIDEMRDGYDLGELANFLYLSEEEFTRKLQGSQNAQAKVGALLQGGRLPFFALQDSINDIINDLNLFRDVNQ